MHREFSAVPVLIQAKVFFSTGLRCPPDETLGHLLATDCQMKRRNGSWSESVLYAGDKVRFLTLRPK